MAEKLKEIPGKILEWWNKFTNKQKTIIVAIVAVAILTFAILVYAFTKPQYVRLGTYESSTEGSEVIKILNDAGITYKESADLKTIDVESGKLAQANYALAVGGYTAGNLKYDEFVKMGMSTTAADRENMYTIYMQEQVKQALELISQVKKATVVVSRPKNYGTLAAQQEESTATVTLTLNGDFTQANAAAMARAVAAMLGNKTTANITIWNQDATLLFAGGDDYSEAGLAHSMQELQEQMQSVVANKVKTVLLGTNQYSLISVAPHLDVDFSTYERTTKQYFAPDGREEGLPVHEDTYNSQSSGGVGGYPGTDSNGGDLTGYNYPDNYNSSSEESETSRDLVVDEMAEYIKRLSGSVVNYGTSSMSISMITVREYHEESVRAQGLLDGGITWAQFKEENRQDVRRAVDEEFYAMAANATGISRDRITIIAYEHPIFYDKEGLNISATDVLSIVMIVLILALLGFVVLRSMIARRAVSEEEELSVESMLQSTPEAELEDIDVEAKSETRKLIEKFVDENPEAAANLLRNWLNDDWN